MRLLAFATIILAAFQICVAADTTPDTSNVPQCGLQCITENVLNSDCLLSNTTCICENVKLNEIITKCIQSNCTIRETLLVERYSKRTCNVPSRDRRAIVWTVGTVFLVLGLFFFTLRVIARLMLSAHTWGSDDWVLLVAVILMVALNGMAFPIAKVALGQEIWDVEPENITMFLYYFFWLELIYLAALPLTKISILLFYLRVFPNRRTRVLCWFFIWFNIAFLIVWELISIFQCYPIEGAWRGWDGEFPTKCNNINIQGWTAAAVTIFSDLAALAIPLPELYKLNLSLGKKIQAMMMFSVGIFVTIVSCLRLQSLAYYATTTNVTQDYVPVGYWSDVEVPVGIICACMPSIRSLFVKMFPRVFGNTERGKSSYANISHQSRKTNTSSRKRASQPPVVNTVLSIRSKHEEEVNEVELSDIELSQEQSRPAAKEPTAPFEPV